jgi:hypothetical protein
MLVPASFVNNIDPSFFFEVKYEMDDKIRNCAIIIQKVWRGYQERVRFKKLLKKTKKRLFIANEILETERAYVNALKSLRSVFRLIYYYYFFLVVLYSIGNAHKSKKTKDNETGF